MIEDYIRAILKAPPSQFRMRQDLNLMMDETRIARKEVIPWEAENEMELLSLNHEFKSLRQPIGKMYKGVFKSIYHEPMMTYAYKAYDKPGLYALCYAATREHRFVFQKAKGRILFEIDGEKVGFITDEWMMYSHRRRLLGRRNHYSPSYYSVVVWDREVAHIRNPNMVDRVNPRVFELLDKLSDKEQLLLMAITFFTLMDAVHGSSGK